MYLYRVEVQMGIGIIQVEVEVGNFPGRSENR